MWQGALIGLTALGVYYLALRWGRTLPEAHTVAFTTMALLQLVHSFNARSSSQSLFEIGVGSNRSLVYAFLASASLQAVVLFVPFLRGFFDTVLLQPTDWAVVLIFSLAPLVAVEMAKQLRQMRVHGDGPFVTLPCLRYPNLKGWVEMEGWFS
ncbi:MAG: cation-translocating P-type ATPase C-terminal domain-containing protein [Syntrophaceticus schinkii]